MDGGVGGSVEETEHSINMSAVVFIAKVDDISGGDLEVNMLVIEPDRQERSSKENMAEEEGKDRVGR